VADCWLFGGQPKSILILGSGCANFQHFLPLKAKYFLIQLTLQFSRVILVTRFRILVVHRFGLRAFCLSDAGLTRNIRNVLAENGSAQ
jgi:hypothetical protein